MFGMKEYERFTDEYEFIDRSTGAENLLMIVAGFQPYYWDEVFRRVLYYSSRWEEDLDVCICVPSADGAVLSIYSEKYSWSLLHVKENHLALAQNMAIRLHPHAKWIYKLDEDILITDGYFGKLKRAYQRTTDLFPVRAGFTAPLLNINGFGSYYYLKAAGCLKRNSENIMPAVFRGRFTGLQRRVSSSGITAFLSTGKWRMSPDSILTKCGSVRSVFPLGPCFLKGDCGPEWAGFL